MDFLWNFYGSNLSLIPFELLFLVLNRLLLGKHFEEAYKILVYSIKNGRDSLGGSESVFSVEQYTQLVQLFVLHCAPSLARFEDALQILDTERALSPWKIQILRDHILELRSQYSSSITPSSKDDNIHQSVPKSKVGGPSINPILYGLRWWWWWPKRDLWKAIGALTRQQGKWLFLCVLGILAFATIRLRVSLKDSSEEQVQKIPIDPDRRNAVHRSIEDR